MSETFDPGPGWREVDRPEAAMHGEVVSYRAERGESPRVRTWVREDPVPPLPTEPYTVIRVTWPEGQVDTAYLVLETGELLDVVLGQRYARDKFERIAGFEVLAEPRAVTAKAVLSVVRAVLHTAHGQIPARIKGAEMDAIARDFGVEDQP